LNLAPDSRPSALSDFLLKAVSVVQVPKKVQPRETVAQSIPLQLGFHFFGPVIIEILACFGLEKPDEYGSIIHDTVCIPRLSSGLSSTFNNFYDVGFRTSAKVTVLRQGWREMLIFVRKKLHEV